MLPNWVVIVVALSYLTALFAVAHVGDQQGRRWLEGRRRSVVYALALGVYCTSWTFLGSVGLASTEGLSFLAIYLGPVLVIGFCAAFMGRIVRLAKLQNITSVADFIAARFGKNQGVAATVTVIAVIGVLPYIALQLKAISASIAFFIGQAEGLSAVPEPFYSDLSLGIALILAFFAMAFGTRHVDATEHQNGLMVAVAAESAVKLVAFLVVGAVAVWGTFDGIGDLWAKAAARPDIVAIVTKPPDPATFASMTLLAAIAIVLLPRQFHVAVVENRAISDVRRAAWLFPLYLVLINLFVVPIAVAGLLMFPSGAIDRDLTVLAVPQAHGDGLVALLALIGGLSAATAMVIVESVALAVMVSNHVVVPLLLRRRGHSGAQGVEVADMGAIVLIVRRIAIVVVLLLGYLYFRTSSQAALASIGLLAFAAIAQIAPAFFGGLVWRRANARGAIAGALLGIAAWGYTLLLPSLAISGSSLLMDGPFGIADLRPTALFGLDLPQLVHGVLVSLTLNVAGFVLFSLSRGPTAIEHMQAGSFALGSGEDVAGTNFRLWRGTVTVDEVRLAVQRYLGPERTSRSFDEFLAAERISPDGSREADPRVLRFAEHLLASAIGAASSRLVLSLLLRRRNVSTKSALKLLDDASAAIQYNRDILQNALDHARQGVTVCDRNLRLVAWNRAFRDLYDLPDELLRIGVGIDTVIAFNAERGTYGQGTREAFIHQRIESLVNATEPVRLRLYPSGTVIEIRTNALPDGGLVTTYTDITDSVLAEEALARANETLERRVHERTEELTRVNGELAKAKAAAEDANLSKTRFLAAASHDILQPLNAARLYTASLLERMPPDENVDLAKNVDASLDAVEEILTALLDISRLDAGAMQPEFKSFRIDELLRQLALEFEPIARERGLRLTFVRSGATVRSDRRLLRRLLQNLVSNAIKYTPEGRVLVGCRRRNGGLSIEICDTGLGIPPGKQKAVFREFHRLDQGARAARGLGLGLSIVERIGKILGHPVGLSSTIGKGSRFSVFVPLADAVPLTVLRSAPQPTAGNALWGTGVLCLDNEPSILDGMARLLTGWGCVVHVAPNLAEALDMPALAADRRLILIADYHLDHGNGLDAIAAIRAVAGVSLPAILLTADRSIAVREAALAAEIQVLNKPVKPAALRAALARWRMAHPVAPLVVAPAAE